MTREEEIRQAQVAIYGTENCRAAEHFAHGASWADAHPANADIIDKVCRWLERELKEYIDVPIYSGSANIYMDALLEDLRNYADSHPHWISVEDELPEVGVAVLTTTQNGTQRVGCYEDGWWLADSPDLVRMGSITHWMPIPQPPKP